MKRLTSELGLFLVICTNVALAQADCTVLGLMSAQEKTDSGIELLSKDQLKALDRWFSPYCSKRVPQVLSKDEVAKTPVKPVPLSSGDQANAQNLERGTARVNTVIEDNELKISSEEAFGFEQKLSNEVDEIKSTISRIVRNPRGRFVVTLKNGQKWRQRETKKIKMKEGDDILIRMAVFGSYDLKHLPSGKRTKVRRVE